MPDSYVLIVGPEAEPRRELADILARAPYAVGRCGWDQLAAELQARTPDPLVLLEEAGVVQPFIRWLKGDDATWNLPIIVALAEFSDTAAAWARSGSGSASKPSSAGTDSRVPQAPRARMEAMRLSPTPSPAHSASAGAASRARKIDSRWAAEMRDPSSGPSS